MAPVTQHLISSYLLMPVLTVIFGIAAYFIARKNKLLNNKKLIVYLLLCGIVLCPARPVGIHGLQLHALHLCPACHPVLDRRVLQPVPAAESVRLGKGDTLFRYPVPADGYGRAAGRGTLLRSVQPLQRTPVRHLGLHLPAAFRLSAPVLPDGKQLF